MSASRSALNQRLGAPHGLADTIADPWQFRWQLSDGIARSGSKRSETVSAWKSLQDGPNIEMSRLSTQPAATLSFTR
jgi:hypothetical protein